MMPNLHCTHSQPAAELRLRFRHYLQSSGCSRATCRAGTLWRCHAVHTNVALLHATKPGKLVSHSKLLKLDTATDAVQWHTLGYRPAGL